MIACIFKKISLFFARFALAMSEWRVSRMLRTIDRLESRIAREASRQPMLVVRYRLAESHYMVSVIERSQKPRRNAIRVLSPSLWRHPCFAWPWLSLVKRAANRRRFRWP